MILEQPKKYTFKLFLAEAKKVIDALKKLPMEEVEGIVISMDTQYQAEFEADRLAADVAKAQVGNAEATPANDK